MLHRSIVRPLLFLLPPETAHEIALHSLSLALRLKTPRSFVAKRYSRSPFGPLERFGLTFANPVGLAAGFDKDGRYLNELAALGFGFIEAGTVTYHAQPGNPRPRIFRLSTDRALINRAGFNNAGAAALAKRLETGRPDFVLGISIGKSRIIPIEEAVEDYLKSFELVHAYADYIAINVSSPNTPGLRDLQRADHLEFLLKALQDKEAELSRAQNRSGVPLLIKVSPDLALAEIELIVDVAKRRNIAGIIATNTTVSRSSLQTSEKKIDEYGQGGLSGAPLKKRSTDVIAKIYQLTSGSLPVIGVGGIFNAADAWEKIVAGSSLIQVYTGFIYEGPSIARQINEGLEKMVSAEGFKTFDEAVGSQAGRFAQASTL